MKKVWSQGLGLVLITLLLSGFTPNTSNAQGSVSLQVFYDELQPYGTWMHHRRFGYVWTPRVERGFVPYSTNGYWVNTEYGNTWVSDYSWGWAPFHYGRWFYDDFYGWIWVPDTEWAPAWVAWRSGGGYYGWAPLMPGFGISLSVRYYHSIPHHYWNFVPNRYITYRTLHYHCVPRPQVVNIINNTTVITYNYVDSHRRTYFTGPSRSEMERTGRTRVDVYRISERSRPGRTDIDRGTVSFYKPEIDNSREQRNHAVPSRYMKDNGNGRMEEVESRSRQPAYVREGNADMNRENHGNASRQDYRTTRNQPWDETNSRGAESRNDSQKDFLQPYRFQDSPNGYRSRESGSENMDRERMRREQSRFDEPKSTNRYGAGRENQQRYQAKPDREPFDQRTLKKEPAQPSQRMQSERQGRSFENNSSGWESRSFQQGSGMQHKETRGSVQRNDEVQRSPGSSRSFQSGKSNGNSRDHRSQQRD